MRLISCARLGLLLVGLLLWGCSLYSGPQFPLAQSVPEPVAVQQQWRLEHREQVYHLQAMVESGFEGLVLVLLDSLGQRLVTVNLRGGEPQILEHQRHPASGIWPRLPEALQFIYWPLPDLQSQAPREWQFSEEAGVRRVQFSGILAAVIEYQTPDAWQGSLRYDNRREDFQVTIESRRLH